MKPDQIKKCNELIWQHNKEEEIEKKRIIRDQAFQLLKDPMMRWIPAILSKKSIYIQPDEILSLSWDCFEFCLARYKLDQSVPLPNHFHAYTRFYLMSTFVRKNKEINVNSGNEENPIETISETFSEGDLEAIFHLDELKQFHACLPSDYKIIFEDAILSMSGQMKDRVRRKEGMPFGQYTEAKKVFKYVIDYLLRR